MRQIFAILLSVFASPAFGSTDVERSEFEQIEHRAQALALSFSAATTREEVLSGLSAEYWAGNQPCSDGCAQNWSLSGGEAVPFTAILRRYSSELNSDNYHYDRPFEAQRAELTL
jgi:hypothetical protein